VEAKTQNHGTATTVKTILGTLGAITRRRLAGAPLPGARGRAGWRRAGRGGRCAVMIMVVFGALALTTAPAESATEGPATMSEVRAQRAAQALQEREARQAQRKAEAEQRRHQKIVEREERAVYLREAREEGESTHSREHGSVEIASKSCGTVAWHFTGFAPGTHTVEEIVSVDGARQPTVKFTFTIALAGETASNTTPLAVTPEEHRIDARAKWVADGVRQGWDIAFHQTCGAVGSEFGYELEKRQKIVECKGCGYVTTPLSGEVGQTIEYQILVHNIGAEFVTLSNFTDPRCDPGTTKGGLEGPLAPGATARNTCTHLITPADQSAGSVSNTATVTGNPYGGGMPTMKTTNTVVVTVPAATGGGNGNGNGNGTGNGSNGSNGSLGSIGVLGTIGSQSPKGGSLAESASVPAISGRPQGCVRSSFVVSIKAKGVKKVVFYLDGHRLRTLTARNARAGKLAIRIPVSKLRIGVHRLLAKITMSPLTASAKAVTATRSVTFARCASANVSPRFTG